MSDEVRQIKDRLNIGDVVGGYVKLQKAGRNYRACCPFHKERTPSFMVSPERGTYMCFGCGEKGDIFSFVQKMESVDFVAALHQLAERAGVDISKMSREHTQSPEKKEHTERLRDACEEATKFFEAELAVHDAAKQYLAGRAMTDETRARWRVGYAPARWESLCDHLTAHGFSHDEIVDAGLAIRSEKKPGEIYDRFRGRIMFPMNDASGRVIAFSGRFFEAMPDQHSDQEPAKYVNSPETELFKKSRVLYGFDKAKEAIRRNDCSMLVEGQFDVVLSHQAGLSFAVAVSGTALTEEHLALLGRASKRLVLALDNDSAGLKAGLRSAAMAFAAGFEVKVPTIEGGKDPAELVAHDAEIWRTAVRAAIPAVSFFLRALRPLAKDEHGYRKLVEQQVVPLVAMMKSAIEQAQAVREIAETLDVPEVAVRAEVAKAKTEASRRPAEGSVPTSPQTPSTPAMEVSNASFLPLEKKIALLLVRFGPDSPTSIRVVELIGSDRAGEITAKSAPLSEQLLFEFESLGDDESAIVENLLADIEHAVVDAQIAQLRRAWRSGEIPTEQEFTKRLHDLMERRFGKAPEVAKKVAWAEEHGSSAAR